MRQTCIIQAHTGEAVDVAVNQTITVVDIKGKQVVDFFAESKDDPHECLSTGVTIDCNESLSLHVGDLLYSNLYRPMFEVLWDDVGVHDLLHPCCRPQMYDFFYGNGEGHPNCLDNINQHLQMKRDLIHPVNLFMHTNISACGKLTVEQPTSKAGDKIVLQAKMAVRVSLAACSVQESRCNGGRCTPIQVILKICIDAKKQKAPDFRRSLKSNIRPGKRRIFSYACLLFNSLANCAFLRLDAFL